MSKPNVAARIVLSFVFALAAVIVEADGHVKSQTVLDDVDPFIGTAKYGHLFPGPKWPNGMVSPSPDSGFGCWSYSAGYQHADTWVHGFSQLHISGWGATDLMDVLLQPFSGKVENDDYRGWQDKRKEKASPGYYSCIYTNFGVKAELTASRRVAYHRYTFAKGGDAHVLVDLAWGAKRWGGSAAKYPRILASESRVLEEGTRIDGHNVTWATVKDREIAYTLEFSRKPAAWRELPMRKQDNKAKRYVFDFNLKDGESVVVKAAVSAVDCDGARANLKADPAGFDFDARLRDVRAAWRELLSRAAPEGDDRQRRIFSTALYHSFLEPSLYSDADGRCRGADRKVHRQDGWERYTQFSLWDTFRAVHPLVTLLKPEIVPDFVKSMLVQYDEIGRVAKLPVWGVETEIMIGDHSIPVIVDAILKGIAGVDEEKAFAAMDATVRTRPHDYDKFGYYPIGDIGSPCSRSLEHGLDDACLQTLAERLGKTERAEFYGRRAQYYRRLYDAEHGVFRARHRDGSWRTPFDPLLYGAGGNDKNFDYTESCALNYAWHVMHDPEGLIKLHGGCKRFCADLDRLFTRDEGWRTRKRDGDCTGLVGEYAQGNEPQNHVAYYYPFVGRSDRAAEVLREICEKHYTDLPNGICGNDDCGALSAWYVFTALGFYPFMPCGGEYIIGAPQIPGATLRLGGRRFDIRATGLSETSKYVSAKTLNGRPLNGFRLQHDELCKGGKLVFTMRSKPPTAAERLRSELLDIGSGKKCVYAWSTSKKEWLNGGFDDFRKRTGASPLLYFAEFRDVGGTWYPPAWIATNRAALAETVRREYEAHGAVPMVTWHLQNPYVPSKWKDPGYSADQSMRYRYVSDGYPQEHRYVLKEILDGTGARCGTGRVDGSAGEGFENPRKWFEWCVRDVAAFCRTLTDKTGARIPIVFRLFHECDGGWFWWGVGSARPEELIGVHRLAIDILRKELGADNVLFCYSPDRKWNEMGEVGKSGFLTQYPGDDYIDMIGYDDYSIGKKNTAETTARAIRKCRLLSEEGTRRNKICGIFETGRKDSEPGFYARLLDIIRAPGVRLAVMTTYDGGYTFPADADEEGWKDMRMFFRSPEVISINEVR